MPSGGAACAASHAVSPQVCARNEWITPDVPPGHSMAHSCVVHRARTNKHTLMEACSRADRGLHTQKHVEVGTTICSDDERLDASFQQADRERNSATRRRWHLSIGYVMRNLFSQCSCGHAHLERIHRHRWMRLLPWLRFYQCRACGKSQLASQHKIEGESGLA